MEEIGVQLYVCVKVLAKAVRDAFTPSLPAIGLFLPLMPSGVDHLVGFQKIDSGLMGSVPTFDAFWR